MKNNNAKSAPQNQGKKKKKGPTAIPRGPRMAARRGLDGPASAWARLLADPFSAPLVHPVYPGGDGGTLARFNSEFVFGAGVGNIGGVLTYVPGGLGPSGATSVSGAATSSEATTTQLGGFIVNQPGFVFLTSNASAIRCVAAGMELIYTGSELSRSGFVGLGQATGSLASEGLAAGVLSVNNTLPLCSVVKRVGEIRHMATWRPTIGDVEWSDPASANATVDYNKKSVIFASVGGLPANVGLLVRLVAVYEYLPKYSSGMMAALGSRAITSCTTDDVLNKLDTTVAWTYGAKAGAFISGAASAYMGNRRQRGGRIEF